MSVTYQDNTAAVKFDVNRAAALGIKTMLDDTYKLSYPVTPKQLGDLRNNVLTRVVGTSGTITWSQSYAEIQERKQFKNYTTPGTGPHFAENSVKTIAGMSDTYFKRAIGSTAMISRKS